MLLRTFFTIFISLHFQSALAETMDFNIEQGKELYVENCITCHMENLSGHPKWKSELDEEGQRQAPPLNGTGHTWHHSPMQLFHIIRYGFKKIDPNYKGKMIGNENLTDDEIWSILEYIKTMWPENIRAKYDTNFSG
ncbi:MAG: cytochrome c [Pelagibacteraceae bacterium]|jgi:mono/diheme cytochrome c family protein|nr:cytochrome c [Pelagibacteraceae bacterium]